MVRWVGFEPTKLIGAHGTQLLNATVCVLRPVFALLISGNLQLPTLSACIPPSYFMVIPHSSIKRHSTTVRIHRRSLILSFRCLYLSIWNMGILWKGVSYSHSALRCMHANLLCQHCLHRLMLYPRLCHKGRALPGDSEELRYPDLWRDRPALCL